MGHATFASVLRHSALATVVAAGAVTPGATGAQEIPQTLAKSLVTLAADSISSRLRLIGRAHLYVAPVVDCDSLARCSNELRTLVRETFAGTAIATLVRPNQRWPTLCDNSDEIRVAVPVVSGDTARVTALSVHAVRGSTQQEALAHTLYFTRTGSRWNLAWYDTATTSVEPLQSSPPPWCLWSPDENSASTAAGLARLRAGPATPINVEESCPRCRITFDTLFRIGHPADMMMPRDSSLVFAARKRFFAQSSDTSRMIVYDSTGAFSMVVGDSTARSVEFGSVDAVVAGFTDSIYVLDNQKRRIRVFSPALVFSREVALPWRVESFHVLRDGRLLTVRAPRREGDPVAIHRANGEVIRTFGTPLSRDGSTCDDCGTPLVAVAPSGYRIWLAWSNRYRIEEWDLSGRQISTMENPQKNFSGAALSRVLEPGIEAGVVDLPGVSHLFVADDGSLWLGYTHADTTGRNQHFVDIIDPARARLVKSFAGISLAGFVAPTLRAIHGVDEYGLPLLRLERFQLDRSQR